MLNLNKFDFDQHVPSVDTRRSKGSFFFVLTINDLDLLLKRFIEKIGIETQLLLEIDNKVANFLCFKFRLL